MEPIFGVIVLFFAIKGVAGAACGDPSQAKPGSGLWQQEKEQARQRWIERSRVRHDRQLQRIQRKGEQKKEADRVKGEQWLEDKSQAMQRAAEKREAYAAKHGRPWKSTADYLAETAKDVAGNVGAAAERGAGKLAETARERQLEREAWRRNERETLPNDPAPSQPDSATPPAEGSTEASGGGDHSGPTDDADPTDNVVPFNRNRTQPQQEQNEDDTSEQDAVVEEPEDTEPSAEEPEDTAAVPDEPASENATSTDTDTESEREGEATPMTEQDAPTAVHESESDTANHAEITSLDGALNYAESMMRFLENAHTRIEQLQAEIESLEKSVTREYHTQEVALASLANEGLENSDVAEYWTQGQAHMEQVSAGAEAMDEKSAELGESLQSSWGCYADAYEKLDEQRPLQEQIAAQEEKNTADSTKWFEYA